MVWGRKAMARIITKNAAKLSKDISKEDFLLQLRIAWGPIIGKNANIDSELEKAMFRINNSGDFKVAFDNVGVTEDDVRQVLQDIKDNKPVQIKVETKQGRNELCACGSGKKYKKCHGR